MILGWPAAVPFLVKKCAEFLMFNENDQIGVLDVLKGMAFKDSMKVTNINRERWKEEWWNELGTASFPCQDISGFPIINHKTLTCLAHDKNTENLDLQAKELKKLSKGYKMMQDLLMPGEDERLGMMQELSPRADMGWILMPL
jgi:hypothetical protein